MAKLPHPGGAMRVFYPVSQVAELAAGLRYTTFETAFQTRMAVWRMDGKPRTTRRFTVYKNCPLPTPEDRLLFILVYLKTYALQVVHGRLFGMVQGKANQWIHGLLPALLAALRALGDAPARSLTALAQRLRSEERRVGKECIARWAA